MICPSCAQEIADDSAQCEYCGTVFYEQPYEEAAPLAAVPAPASSYGFRALGGILALLGAAAIVVGSVVKYYGGEGPNAKVVDFNQSYRLYVWSLIAYWGTALVLGIVGLVMISGRKPGTRAAALLTGAGLVLVLQMGAAFFKVVARDQLPNELGLGVTLEFAGAVAAFLGGLTGLARSAR